jgi:hypothetical protein
MEKEMEAKLNSLVAEEAIWSRIFDWCLGVAYAWALMLGPTIGIMIAVVLERSVLLLWLGPAVAALAAAGFCRVQRNGRRVQIKALEIKRDTE